MHSGIAEARATFELSLDASAPEPFFVLAGLEPLLDALERLRVKAEELEWLRSVGAVDGPVAQKLSGFRFGCDVEAMPEGTVVFGGEPLLVVEGPLWQAQLVASYCVSAIESSTRYAGQFARAVLAAETAEVLEAGSTAVHRLGGNALLARAAYVGGAGATTNALAGRRYQVPVRARQPGSFVLAHATEVGAFESWLRAVPDQAILRIDARDAAAGIDRAVQAIRSRATATWSDAPVAIELCGGDVVEVARTATRAFERAGLKAPVIVVSGDLDEHRIDTLRRAGAPIAAYVYSPQTDCGPSAHYDLVAIEDQRQWSPRVRLGRTVLDSSMPGRKVLLRYFDADGRPLGDVAHLVSERHMSPKDVRLVERATGFPLRLRDAASSTPMLRKVLQGGKRAQPAEAASDSRERALRGMRSLPEAIRRRADPSRYPVGVSAQLAALQAELVSKPRDA
jgi:nicotinate phosphoribosyltransferase